MDHHKMFKNTTIKYITKFFDCNLLFLLKIQAHLPPHVKIFLTATTDISKRAKR